MLTSVDVGALVTNAKGSSGLSVRRLASNARVAGSTITRIQSGTVDPTVDTLARIVDAAGFELQVTAMPRGIRRPTRLETWPTLGPTATVGCGWIGPVGGESSTNWRCTPIGYRRRSTSHRRRPASESSTRSSPRSQRSSLTTPGCLAPVGPRVFHRSREPYRPPVARAVAERRSRPARRTRADDRHGKPVAGPPNRRWLIRCSVPTKSSDTSARSLLTYPARPAATPLSLWEERSSRGTAFVAATRDVDSGTRLDRDLMAAVASRRPP